MTDTAVQHRIPAEGADPLALSGVNDANLAELGRRGFPIYEEPGRQVVKEQLYIGGDAVPWGNVSEFVGAYDLPIHASHGNRPAEMTG